MHRVAPVLLQAAVLCCMGTAAAAQDVTVLYGIRSHQAVDRIPVNPPYHYRIAPRPEQGTPAPRVIEITPDAQRPGFAVVRPAERGNPLTDLLSDPTLRPGDVAMFADGPRVFAGEPFSRRGLSDFVPAASGARLLPPAMREYVLRLRPGWSDRWAGVDPGPPARTAQSVPAPQRSAGFEVVRVPPPR